MKSIYIAGIVAVLSSSPVFSDTANSSPTQPANSATSNNLRPVCLLSGFPPADHKYSVVKEFRIGKHFYGSVNDVIPRLVQNARKYGADAVIDYSGSQRFGFWPWQMVRPVVSGIAVNWSTPGEVDCEGIGGTYKTALNGPLTSDT